MTEDDARRVAEIALETSDVMAAVQNDGMARWDALCAEIVAADRTTIDAVEVASQFDVVERQKAERLTTYFRSALARLSPAGRAAIETDVDTNVRPRMVWGHDLAGLAREVPEAWLTHRTAVCRQQLSLSPDQKRWTRVERNLVAPQD